MQTLLFARITKIDEKTRTVTGRAAHEVVDSTGEVFDYASSKPQFQKWSAEVFADSNGLSYGNVRSMHGNVAAGKLTDIEFNDVERAIDVSAKIVDDGEWEKCLQGVHTGFSIGGHYAKKWTEAQNGRLVTRYTAVPLEISLVDRPCIPTAKFFAIHKTNGSVIRRPFANLQPCIDMHKVTTLAIRAIHGQGPSLPEPLVKGGRSTKPVDTAMHKARRLANGLVDGMSRAGIKPSTLLSALAGGAYTGVQADSVDAIHKIHAQGARKGFPPQSDNGQWSDGPLADDGADGTWNDQTAPKTKPAAVGLPHSASISAAQAPAQDSDIDPTVAALKRIFAAGPQRGL